MAFTWTEFLRDEFFTPIGLADTYLGLPDDHWPRHVPLKVGGPAALADAGH